VASSWGLDGVATSGTQVTWSTAATGATSSLDVSATLGYSTVSGTTYGSDGNPGYGGVTEVVLIPNLSSATTYPIRVFMKSDGGISGCYIDISLRDAGSNYHQIGSLVLASTTSAEWLMGGTPAAIDDYVYFWAYGVANASLVARLVNADTPDGGTADIYAIANQA